MRARLQCNDIKSQRCFWGERTRGVSLDSCCRCLQLSCTQRVEREGDFFVQQWCANTEECVGDTAESILQAGSLPWGGCVGDLCQHSSLARSMRTTCNQADVARWLQKIDSLWNSRMSLSCEPRDRGRDNVDITNRLVTTLKKPTCSLIAIFTTRVCL